jgi:uncharacterized membrane protein
LFARAFELPAQLPMAGDAFFGAYLASMIGAAARVTPALMRKRAASGDEGIAIIVLLTLAAVSLSLGSMFAC